jgi:hypothetical protein
MYHARCTDSGQRDIPHSGANQPLREALVGHKRLFRSRGAYRHDPLECVNQIMSAIVESQVSQQKKREGFCEKDRWLPLYFHLLPVSSSLKYTSLGMRLHMNLYNP